MQSRGLPFFLSKFSWSRTVSLTLGRWHLFRYQWAEMKGNILTDSHFFYQYNMSARST